MYAVIATGGKQYKVAEGDVIRIEQLPAEAGEEISFDKVLLIANGEDISIGTPYLEGRVVNARVTSHGRGEKVRIVKFRRRKHHMKQMGHRQNFTEVEITSIGSGSGKPAVKKAAAPKKAEAAPSTLKFLDKPQGEPDDLKKISGVGPVLEGKLHDLGIYHFSQIAAFTPEQIAQVDEVLNFKGRIEREDWVGQAKILAAGGETEHSKKN
jgi:large subunit ribosomal protein L21